MKQVLVSFFTDYKDALITVSWVLAAVGWVITNRQSNTREKRKETRTEVDAICKAAAELLATCRKYYASGPDDAEDDARAAQIAFEVKRILVRTERLNRRVPKFKKAKEACGQFFDDVTQEPFQSKKRAKHGPGSALVRDIEDAVHSLIDQLEEGFSSAYS